MGFRVSLSLLLLTSSFIINISADNNNNINDNVSWTQSPHHAPSYQPVAAPAPAPRHHHHHHNKLASPPVSHAPTKAPVHAPVHPPTKAPVQSPTTSPAPVLPPLPPRKLVAIQGVVYCKACKYKGVDTLNGAKPLQATKMSNIAKIEFPALNITGENYMPWTAHVKRHLKSMGVLDTLQDANNCSEQDKAKADVFLHKHIDEMLQFEYSNVDDPCVLWKDLQSRFDHQREVLLPTARDEWNNLRFQDFKKVNEYTSALFRICSTLRFCGQTVTEEDMLEKTFSTFHASNINLQQQYRLQKFQRYSDLNSFLLVAEKNNELLMKNHQARPTGSLAIPEANVVNNDDIKNSGRKWGRGRGRGHFDKTHINGRNHSFKRNNNYNRGNYHGRGRGRGRGRSQRANNYHIPQNSNAYQQHKFKNETGTSQNYGSSCFRCGSTNHWSKACRTPSHLCKLYQASLKGKEKEVNHVDKFDNVNTELNTSDFISDSELYENCC